MGFLAKEGYLKRLRQLVTVSSPFVSTSLLFFFCRLTAPVAVNSLLSLLKALVAEGQVHPLLSTLPRGVLQQQKTTQFGSTSRLAFKR